MEIDSAYDLYTWFFGAGILIAPEYLAVAILIAFVIWKLKPQGKSFWAWLLPREIYFHPSHFLDIKLFFLGRVIGLFGLFNRIALTSAIAIGVSSLIALRIGPGPDLNPWLIAAAILVLNDFIIYWVHRIYHTTPALWPIHSVHHSAEVLTPVTAYRQHPLADVIATLTNGIIFGLAQGVFLGLFAQEYGGMEIAGVNALFFFFALLTANFRHSHIWISFGPFWEHVFISPAQHQIHHSTAPRHMNKNFGENLAIWDWMFGSLYVPRARENFEIGIADADGQPQAQRHTGLWAALIIPLKDIAQALRPSSRRSENDG